MERGPDWQVPGYADVEELGRGGFGRVVLARRLADGAPVAVKYLSERLVGDPWFRAEFQREAGMLAGLRSAHTVRLYEYLETGGEPVTGAAIVMEYVPGASLRKLLASAQGAPMPPQAALGILKGSLLGLGDAHGVGVVHRDYKPENVLVRPEGVSVLADFGIAMRSGDQAAAVIGTPPYMAPEQFVGAPASAAADVYAATAVFFECVAGRLPIAVESRDLDSWARAHTTGRVPVEMAPAPVQALIARGLSKDPAQRPAQALAFAAELERVAAQAYGPDWEGAGRQVLIGALTGLAATGVLLSLVPGLVGPLAPLPMLAPSPLPMPPAPMPVSPAPMPPGVPTSPAPMPPDVPPSPPGAPPAPTPSPSPGAPGLPHAAPGVSPPNLPPGAPGTPGYPSAPQTPYPHPHIPRPNLWRRLLAKLGAAKAIAAVTAAVVVVAGGTIAIVVATTQTTKTPTSNTPTSNTPTQNTQALVLDKFTGDWSAHSAGLSIKPDGTFTIFWRDYSRPMGANDTVHGSGRLTTATANAAEGQVTQSDATTGDSAIPLGTVHLAFSQDDDTVKITLSNHELYTFCGSDAQPGFCGA